MKAITQGSYRPVPTKSKEPLKPQQNSNEVEATVWVLMALFGALVVAFGYLFWNKF